MTAPSKKIAAEVGARYGLDVREMARLSGGYDKSATSWRLETERGSVVVRVDSGMDVETAGWLRDIQGLIEAAGVPCARFVLSEDRAAAFTIAGATATLCSFLDGTPLSCSDLRDDLRKIRAAGRALGRIHRAGVGIEAPRSTVRAEYVEADAGDLADIELDRWHRDFMRRRGSEMTRGLVHGDFCAENLICLAMGGVAVIDWGGARSDVQARELAWGTCELGHDSSYRLRPVHARAFLRGYRDVAGRWGPGLKEALIPLMRYELRRYIEEVAHDHAGYRRSLTRGFKRLDCFDAWPLFESSGP